MVVQGWFLIARQTYWLKIMILIIQDLMTTLENGAGEVVYGHGEAPML